MHAPPLLVPPAPASLPVLQPASAATHAVCTHTHRERGRERLQSRADARAAAAPRAAARSLASSSRRSLPVHASSRSTAPVTPSAQLRSARRTPSSRRRRPLWPSSHFQCHICLLLPLLEASAHVRRNPLANGFRGARPGAVRQRSGLQSIHRFDLRYALMLSLEQTTSTCFVHQKRRKWPSWPVCRLCSWPCCCWQQQSDCGCE